MPNVTPFPGMDPYLEHPVLWPGVHTRLMVQIGDLLAPQLLPRYAVSVEERVFLDIPEPQRIPDLWIQQPRSAFPGPPAEGALAVLEEVEAADPVIVETDPLEVREPYLEILDRYRRQQVVTVIEVLSPTNKRPGPGRDSYLSKQRATLASEVNLVEVDVLRTGSHALAIAEHDLPSRPEAGYLISVNRHSARTRFELYPWLVRDRMPALHIPLAPPDRDVVLNLQTAFERVYQGGSYMIRVKYDEPCDPPLPPDDQAWASECWARYRAAHPEWFPPAQNGEPPGE